MKWSRTPPNKDGYWLRLNAGGGLDLRLVLKGKIMWGWGGDEKMIPITHRNLKGWLWCGPIPVPPENVERLVRSEGE